MSEEQSKTFTALKQQLITNLHSTDDVKEGSDTGITCWENGNYGFHLRNLDGFSIYLSLF